MKELSASDRPREKLLRHGVAALGDNELIALVLGSGGRRAGALALANELLATRGGLHGLVRSTCDELARVAGIGRARAAQIVAALELGRRTLAHAPSARVQIRSPREAASYLMPAFGSRPVEQFGVVLLDTKHRVIRTAVLAVGTLNTTIVEPRDVFREAAVGRAAAIVVFHNHPIRRSHRQRRRRRVDAAARGGRRADGDRRGGSHHSGRRAVLQLQGNGAVVSDRR